MKSNFSIVVWMMVVSVLLKMLVYAGGYQFTNYERFAIFGNIFVLMTGIFLGIRLHKKTIQQKTEFLADFKAGMRVAAMYAIFMSLFVYIYYSFIDSSYFATKLQNQLQLAEESGGDIDLNQIKQTGEFVLSPFFQTTITLIGFLLLGTFYASLITFFMRQVRGFGH